MTARKNVIIFIALCFNYDKTSAALGSAAGKNDLAPCVETLNNTSKINYEDT
jgi:hypothetical protein